MQSDIEKKAREYNQNHGGDGYNAFLAGASAREEEYRALVEAMRTEQNLSSWLNTYLAFMIKEYNGAFSIAHAHHYETSIDSVKMREDIRKGLKEAREDCEAARQALKQFNEKV
jgi:23S rRNA A2030 N6-methylase RlmJ